MRTANRRPDVLHAGAVAGRPSPLWSRTGIFVPVLALALLALPASAQDAEEPTAENSEIAEYVDGSAALNALVTAMVLVSDIDDNFQRVPQAGAEVQLDIIRPPHAIVDSLTARTNEAGIATFTFPPMEGAQAFARVEREGATFSARGLDISNPGMGELEIAIYREVDSPEGVFATRLISISELAEDYIVFTQIWNLAMDRAAIFRPDLENRLAGLQVPLPEDATGVVVVRPEEDFYSVIDNVVYLRSPIEPAGTSNAAGLVVRFAIHTQNSARLNWEQRFNFDVQNMSVVIPQSSPHPGFEALDVELDVDLCDGPETVGNRVCFSEVSDSAEGVQMLEGVPVRIARGGRASAGDVVYVRTRGWPSPPRWERWLALIAALTGLFAGLGFVLRHRRFRGEGGFDPMALLAHEKEQTLAAIAALHSERDTGTILEADFEVEKSRLSEQLAGIHRRIRESSSDVSA